MRTVRALGVAFSCAVAAVACEQVPDEPSPRNFNTGADGGASSSTIDAGRADGSPASAQCTPKSCAELGPGAHPDDGCGNPLTCTPACTDADEPNDTKSAAKLLDPMTDNPNTTKVVADLTLGDADVDWFSARVTDSGFGGNPVIDVTTTQPLEITLFYTCDSQPDYSTCSKGDPVTETDGAGCKASGEVTLATECKGIDETGTAYIRIRKPAADGQCSRYGLSIDVK